MCERANYDYNHDCAAQVSVPLMMLGAAGAGIIRPGAGIIEAEDTPAQHN